MPGAVERRANHGHPGGAGRVIPVGTAQACAFFLSLDLLWLYQLE
jgi:hypothetical protein